MDILDDLFADEPILQQPADTLQELTEAELLETKLEATQRLRREGRWEEASRFKEQERLQLRAAGVPRKKAVTESWQAMLERFPPFDEEIAEHFVRFAARPSPLELVEHFPLVYATFCTLMSYFAKVRPNLFDRERFREVSENRIE